MKKPAKSSRTVLGVAEILAVYEVPLKSHRLSLEGVSVSRFIRLIRSLDVSAEQAAPMIGMSRATLQRYKLRPADEKLPVQIGARVVRIEQIVGEATRVLGSLDAANEWLLTQQRALDFERPIDVLATEHGSTAVEQLLGRIDHGVYT